MHAMSCVLQACIRQLMLKPMHVPLSAAWRKQLTTWLEK